MKETDSTTSFWIDETGLARPSPPAQGLREYRIIFDPTCFEVLKQIRQSSVSSVRFGLGEIMYTALRLCVQETPSSGIDEECCM